MRNTLSHQKNPYYGKHDAPILVNSYCVYLDILGFSDLSLKMTKKARKEALLSLNSALNSCIDVLFPSDRNMLDLEKHFSWIKTFSDNLIVGQPILRKTYEHEYLESELKGIALFQLLMAEMGYFMRGAITIGDLHIGDNIVFGKPLIDAVSIEKTIAKYPRILISNRIANKIRTNLRVGNHFDWYDMILEDYDGQLFVNYMNYRLPDIHEHIADAILKQKEQVEKHLNDVTAVTSDKNIHDKYLWITDYHNRFCKKYIPDNILKYYSISLTSPAFPKRELNSGAAFC